MNSTAGDANEGSRARAVIWVNLSCVITIAKDAGGGATLHSEPGRGTTVRIYIPAANGHGRSRAAGIDSAQLEGDGRVVLVGEDEPQLREVTT